MEVNITNYKGYIITTEEGEEKGIFFRNPLQKVLFDTCGYGNFSAYEYSNRIKNPIRRFYEILIGNRKTLKELQKFLNRVDCAGFFGNKLCSPIYFQRKYRKLTAVYADDGNPSITEIRSYGYESEFNYCDGACHLERTKVSLKNGKVMRLKAREYFHFTFKHIVEEVIDTGVINLP